MTHRMTRRSLLAATAGGIAATSVTPAGAQANDAWPSKPIKVIMPFGAGGSMDTLSRLLAPIVSETLGQQVVVENRPGATGTVTMAAVASAPADGYTLMFTGSSYSIIALLIAVPVSFGIALFLTELSPAWLKRPLGTAIELLAAVPSIVYGMWGLLVFGPVLAQYVQTPLQSALDGVPYLGALVSGPPGPPPEDPRRTSHGSGVLSPAPEPSLVPCIP